METTSDLLAYVSSVLEDLGIPYAIGGSMAAIAYGEPRYTRDLDVVVEVTLGQLPAILQRFPPPDFYVDRVAAREAVMDRSQFNVIHPASGLKVDFYIAGDRIAHEQVARAERLATASGIEAKFSRPEELILKKLEFYARGDTDRQLRDITSLLRIRPEIDRDRIAQTAQERGLAHIWEVLLKRMERE